MYEVEDILGIEYYLTVSELGRLIGAALHWEAYMVFDDIPF